MSKNNTVRMADFLTKYKELETVLRNSDTAMSIMQYEETLDADSMDKLRICRQMRNYVQHHDDGDGFLTATVQMTDYIDSLIRKESSKKECAKDRLYRLSALSADMTLADVLERFASTKRELLPVVDEKGLFLGMWPVTEMLPFYVSLGNRKKLKAIIADPNFRKKLLQVHTVTKDTPLEGLNGQDLAVIGKEGKYLGVVKW